MRYTRPYPYNLSVPSLGSSAMKPAAVRQVDGADFALRTSARPSLGHCSTISLRGQPAIGSACLPLRRNSRAARNPAWFAKGLDRAYIGPGALDRTSREGPMARTGALPQPICERGSLAALHTASLQKRRNSQVTQRARLAGGGGKRSSRTRVWMAATVWPTRRRRCGVIGISSAWRKGMW